MEFVGILGLIFLMHFTKNEIIKTFLIFFSESVVDLILFAPQEVL